MTVTYTPDVANTNYVSWLRMMVRWRGSLWKSVIKELIVWAVLYAVLSLIYRLALEGDSKKVYEKVVHYFYKFSDWVPLTFMLGFYVTLVLNRWWTIINNIGFIDNLSLVVANYIRGNDDRSIMYKRGIMRYMCLVQAMVYRAMSNRVKRKYPSLQSLVDAGYLEPAEMEKFSENNFFLSVHWAMAYARKARDEGLIASDHALQDIFQWCTSFRWSQITLWVFHWIPVPLVYTQVVFTTVRLYFVLALIGRQFTDSELNDFPVSSSL